MAYKKKYATDEERRKALSAAGKAGVEKRIALGHNFGGRKKNNPNRNPKYAIPTRTLTVREPDYKVFVKGASDKGSSIIDFMHNVAKNIESPEISPQARAVFNAIVKHRPGASIKIAIDGAAKKVIKDPSNSAIKADADAECPFPPEDLV